MNRITGNVGHIPRGPRYYLATPYTRFAGGGPPGWRMAYVEACYVAKQLSALGLHVYSPIVEAHPLADMGLAAHDNAEYWSAWCAARMPLFDALIVADNMDGWECSSGVLAEIRWFKQQNRPVYYVTGRASD